MRPPPGRIFVQTIVNNSSLVRRGGCNYPSRVAGVREDALVEKTVVNSWNEWDPLKHVIVGRADDCHIPPEEPALDAKVPEDSDMRGQWGRRPQETIDRANELLDNFAALLEKRGIRVDRPTSIDHSLPAATPDFHAESQFGCMPPRDVLLTVGLGNPRGDDVLSLPLVRISELSPA